MANNEEEEEQMSDSDDMPYIKCEAVYGEEGDDDDEISALPFVKTEFGEDNEDENRINFGMKAPEVGAYVKCSVPSCHSYFEVGNPKYEGFSHFKFPDDPTLRSHWISIIGLKEDWKPEGAMICSNHFQDGSFINVLEMAKETGQLMTKRSLKPGAVPTLNIGARKIPLWNPTDRVVFPTNNGSLVPPVPATVPVQPPQVRPVVAAIRPPPSPTVKPSPPPTAAPPTPIRTPYSQNEPPSRTSTSTPGRVVMLTKNGKRRGRPPKNAHLLNNSESSILSPSANGISPNQSNNSPGLTKPLPPFQILGMGRRKRGRPRKEESLQRLAAGLVPIKRRKILPAPSRLRQSSASGAGIEQLECNVDLGHFFATEDVDPYQRYNVGPELQYFQALPSNISDLSSVSLAELQSVVESTLKRLRSHREVENNKSASEAEQKESKEEVKSQLETKEKKVNVENVRIPPSVSIKPVGPKSSSQGTSTSEEELVPALTITIRRDAVKTDCVENGKSSPKSKIEKEETPPPRVEDSASEDAGSEIEADGKESDQMGTENDNEPGTRSETENGNCSSSSDNEVENKVNGEVSS